jgi:hypothetical protein
MADARKRHAALWLGIEGRVTFAPANVLLHMQGKQEEFRISDRRIDWKRR